MYVVGSIHARCTVECGEVCYSLSSARFHTDQLCPASSHWTEGTSHREPSAVGGQGDIGCKSDRMTIPWQEWQQIRTTLRLGMYKRHDCRDREILSWHVALLPTSKTFRPRWKYCYVLAQYLSGSTYSVAWASRTTSWLETGCHHWSLTPCATTPCATTNQSLCTWHG